MTDIKADIMASEKLRNHHTAGVPLRELAVLFLRLGCTAFGGPAAHIALMRAEVVERHGWLTEEQYLDLVGAANLIPGPSSTEVAIHIGFLRAGWPGLVIAGVCFILPAALLVTAIAWAYQRFGHLPTVTGVLYGVKPVVIAVVLQALLALGRKAARSRLLWLVGAAAALAVAAGCPPLAILLVAGLMSAGEHGARSRCASGWAPVAILLTMVGGLALLPALLDRSAALSSGVGMPAIFAAFVKLGSVVYGSGYVLLAFLQSELVTRRSWLTSSQLLDAVAVGQITPGPVFTTATFIGFLLAGPRGAIVATLGMFLPAFLFVAISGRLVPRLRRSPIAAAFLDGVNVGSLGLMAAVLVQLGHDAIRDGLTAALSVMSAVVLVRFRTAPARLLLFGAVAGVAATAMRR